MTARTFARINPSVNIEENKISLTKELFKAVISTETWFGLKLFGFFSRRWPGSIKSVT